MAVRATRFGCKDAKTSAASKRAFQTLHRLYGSSWAKSTPYFTEIGQRAWVSHSDARWSMDTFAPRRAVSSAITAGSLATGSFTYARA